MIHLWWKGNARKENKSIDIGGRLDSEMADHWMAWPLLVVLCFVSGAVTWQNDLRLPQTIIPESYRIKILPMLIEGDFRLFGNVRMDFFTTEPTDRIVMHAVNLTIDEKITVNALKNKCGNVAESVEPRTEELLDVANEMEDHHEGFLVTYDNEKEFVVIELPWTLNANRRYRIKFSYRGQLSEESEGLQLSHYQDRKTGSKRYTNTSRLTTQNDQRRYWQVAGRVTDEAHGCSQSFSMSRRTRPESLIPNHHRPQRKHDFRLQHAPQ